MNMKKFITKNMGVIFFIALIPFTSFYIEVVEAIGYSASTLFNIVIACTLLSIQLIAFIIFLIVVIFTK